MNKIKVSKKCWKNIKKHQMDFCSKINKKIK